MGELSAVENNNIESPVETDVKLAVARCANCGVALLGPYCSDCGQQDREVRRPFWRIFAQLFNALFDLDARVYRSLYFLYTRPGFLSNEYLNGRRERYTPPLRMFLALSITYFLIVWLAGVFGYGFVDEADLDLTAGGDEQQATPGPGQQIREALEDDAGENGLADLNLDPQEIRAGLAEIEIPFLPSATEERLKAFMVDQAVRNFSQARDNPREFFRDFIGESLEYVTVFILLMMPLLAFVLWVLLFFKGRYYVEHFILTLHNHSFLLVSTYLLGISGLFAGQLPSLAGFFEWVENFIVLWILIYLYLSLKNFYECGHPASGLVYVAATAIYGTLTLVGLAFFLLISFLLF